MLEFKKHKLDKILPSPFDPRDIYFSNKMCSTISLPDSIDLACRIKRIENQQNLGTCTGMGGSTMMEILETFNNKPYIELSPLYLYYKAREIEGTVNFDNGAYLRDTMKVLQKNGICEEKYFPFIIKDFAKKPSQEAELNAKNHMIEGYQRLNSINQIKTCLSQNKPVLVGMKLYSSFDTKVSAVTGIIPVPNKSVEQYEGSHCMVIVGYDDNFAIKHNLKLKNNLCGGYFKIANSWGKEWGNNGFCYVPYELIEDMHDLWAVKEGGKNGLFNSIINVVSNIISNSFKK